MKGQVKWFCVERGFGFIDFEGKDVFVHHSSIIDRERGLRNLVEGEWVEYDLVKTTKGYRAKNVRTAI